MEDGGSRIEDLRRRMGNRGSGIKNNNNNNEKNKKRKNNNNRDKKSIVLDMGTTNKCSERQKSPECVRCHRNNS